MTKKVAEKIVKGITDKIECNTADIDDWAEFWGFTREEYEEFLDVAIESLEKDDILDKIRTEIMRKDGLEEALEIIDKYKAESEDK